MSVGKLVWQGSLADLRAEQEPLVRVDTAAPVDAAKVLIELGLAEVRTSDAGARARLNGVAPEQVVAALVRAGVGVRGFAVERPSLEEQFVGLTGEGFDVSG
jgi:ABC-2 type transport system ATP-binding protein